MEELEDPAAEFAITPAMQATVPKWAKACDWTLHDDAMLLLGVYRHGMDNWVACVAIPFLSLLPSPSELLPTVPCDGAMLLLSGVYRHSMDTWVAYVPPLPHMSFRYTRLCQALLDTESRCCCTFSPHTTKWLHASTV